MPDAASTQPRIRIAAVAAVLLALTFIADLAGLADVAGSGVLVTVRGYGLIALTLWCTIEAFAAGRRGHAALASADAAAKRAHEAAQAQAIVAAKAQAQRAVDEAKSDAQAALDRVKADAESAIATAKNEAAHAKAAATRLERELHAERLKTPEREVVSLLSLLQSRGRFVDFLMDDITKYADAQVGAAARVVHQGCAGVVREYFDIKPVRQDAEGTSLTLEKDFDAHSVRLLGKVLGEPPFRGRLLHRGWQTASVNLPKVQADAGGAGLIAPAEVELN